jgi:putative OPT family oligopeptide transporter
VLCVATIANDNLQDLKTGQLVDATPWRQQVALVIGVIFGSVVIPPILDLLNRAYGFNGAPAAAHPAGAQPLPAPQATLISALAQGVITGKLDWGLIGIGVLAGIALIALDELLGVAKRLRLPPLGVGIAIYLPPSTTLPVILGAIAGWAYDRWAERGNEPERAKRMGILLASGLIVGESLFGVLLAGMIVLSANAAPLAVVGDAFAPAANWIGSIAFALFVAALYRGIARSSR